MSSSNDQILQPPIWHQLEVAEILQRLDTDIHNGLSAKEAKRRLEVYGTNEPKETGRRNVWKILYDQFRSTMVVVLLLAAGVSLVLGDTKDAVAILAIVVLNAVFGFAQDFRAEKAVAALKKLAAPKVRVQRDGVAKKVPAREIVPGDILLPEVGDHVGADCRLLKTVGLRLDESPLTGESGEVKKNTKPLPEETLLADRSNMIWLGTTVTRGRGTAIVTETGMRTELGRIAGLLQTVGHELTPLQRRLDRLGRSMAITALAIVAIISAIGLLRGEEIKLLFMTAVSMAVAVVPEGLPAVVTIVLALGAQRMLKRHALIRRLSAVETLGSVTVICSDKTGTLTENRMAVTALEMNGRSVSVGTQDHLEPDFDLLLMAGALCSTTTTDPTETALISVAKQFGISKAKREIVLPRVAEKPFDSERKRMTTVHRIPSDLSECPDALQQMQTDGRHYIIFTKGAVENVLQVCTRGWKHGRTDELANSVHLETAEALAKSGKRVLGLAFRLVDTLPDSSDFEHDLIFLGMVGLSDPPRAEVKEAVALCKNAGIRPVMITGDHPLTAQHVAEELGMDGNILTGSELVKMSDHDLKEKADNVSIYARVLPEHKFKIVKSLQASGHVVAMTGDGVNDAPALKKANIGVAMGITGTDVAKQAADMVLLDDNFSTIVAAIEEGRAIYDNIRKFVRYVLAGNVGEIFVMLLGPLCGLPLPLLPLQILWINLVTDGVSGLALSVEPAERNAMQRPPYSAAESIFARGAGIHILWVGLLTGLAPLGIGYFYWAHSDPAWQTIIFVTLAFEQIFQTLAVQSWNDSFFSRRPTWIMMASVTLSVALTLAILYLPFLQNTFGTVALGFYDLLFSIVLSTAVFWSIELDKWFHRTKERQTCSK